MNSSQTSGPASSPATVHPLRANVERNFLDPRRRFAHAGMRGVLISHLIGACFAISFLFGPALPQHIALTRVFDWPIRILGLWLLVDRFGKQRSLKFTAWDMAHVLFVAAYGCALIYAELFMTRDTGLINFV